MSGQHPGKILQQHYLLLQSISQNKLARAIQVPPRRINEIILGKRGITADTAVRLAIYFGNNASYWMQLQAEYEIEKVKSNITFQLRNIQTQQPPGPLSTEKETRPSPISTNSVKKRIMR